MVVVYPKNLPQVNAGIAKALRDYQRQVVEACGVAVDETAAEVVTESNQNAPIDTGALVDSSHKDDSPAIDTSSASEIVGYSVVYAARVHENMQAKKPKFLERAVLSVGPSLRENAIKELKS